MVKKSTTQVRFGLFFISLWISISYHEKDTHYLYLVPGKQKAPLFCCYFTLGWGTQRRWGDEAWGFSARQWHTKGPQK